MTSLAIVIPAYKNIYLDDVFKSLSLQTCKNFTVYVGDDASPNDLLSICRRWDKNLDIIYHRFSNNIGGRNLIAQWERCIDLTSKEEWIWLFSDDDVLDPRCVELFFNAVADSGSKFDLFHFNVREINQVGEIVRDAPVYPLVLQGQDFALGRFKEEISSYATEYVFRKSTYDFVGRFQNFPRAWCSDDATWIKISGFKGIKTILGAKVGWRYSGLNISSNHLLDKNEKLEAAIQFLEWLNDFFEKNPELINKDSRVFLGTAALWWLFKQAFNLKAYFWVGNPIKRAMRISKSLGATIPWYIMLIKIFMQDRRTFFNY